MTNKRPQSSLGLYHFPNIDPGTQSRIESFPPGQLFIETCSARGDEITPIADYIAAEMNTNAHGAAARTGSGTTSQRLRPAFTRGRRL